MTRDADRAADASEREFHHDQLTDELDGLREQNRELLEALKRLLTEAKNEAEASEWAQGRPNSPGLETEAMQLATAAIAKAESRS